MRLTIDLHRMVTFYFCIVEYNSDATLLYFYSSSFPQGDFDFYLITFFPE